MKYNKNFERDFAWYEKHKDYFIFDGQFEKEIKIDMLNGQSAKYCFYIKDTEGKIIPTNEPDLLNKILKCKGSINFHIKMWAEDRAKGYLPKIEFEKIIKEYELLDWIVKAVERQKYKYYEIRKF